MGGIRLSKKHGLNPSMGLCFYCGEPDGTVVIPGALKGDAEAPRYAVWSLEPCDRCKALMQQGVFFIVTPDNATPGDPNPERLGVFVLKEAAVRRIFEGPRLGDLLRRRSAFITKSVADQLGWPGKE